MLGLTNIQEIKSELGYRDMRSVIKFLGDRIPIIKIGKNYYVVSESWDAFVAGLIDNKNANYSPKRNKYQPTGKAEKEFLNELNSHLHSLP